MEERAISSEYVYRGQVVNLRLDTVQLPSGRTTRREIVEHRPVVSIVAVDERENVLLVRQYRKAAGQELLEIPAGGVDEGEDLEAAVRRELREETGYSAEKLERLTGIFSSPGFCNEYMHIFLATGIRPGAQAPAEDETIEVVPTPLAEVPSLISKEQICDAKSVVGLLTLFWRLGPPGK